MAVVLPSEESSYFGSSSLRRSHSQPKFASQGHAYPPPAQSHPQPQSSRIQDPYGSALKIYPDSAPSTAPSSPRTLGAQSVDELSYSSTPASSNLSVSSDFDDGLQLVGPPKDDDDHFVLHPAYSHVGYGPEDLEPPTSPRTGDSYTVSPAEAASSSSTSRPESPAFERPADDTDLRPQPSRHVDYLSHNWKEEDIWSSWKYIVSRRGEVNNAARLENASWRSWIKAKNNLKTVSPETLNWLKDCDVTWLYGPLQTGGCDLFTTERQSSSSRLPLTNSFLNKKPILKKRSMSEIMLQRSLSSSSLLKQAAAVVQAQEKEGKGMARPRLQRAHTDYATFPYESRRMSRENSLATSNTTSGVVSPTSERKHIHFNEQVEQCIAVDVKGDDEEDADVDRLGGNSDSSDDGVMMKRSRRKRTRLSRKASGKRRSSGDGKTIAMLPSTTLKYRAETPEPQDTAMKHSTGSFRNPVVSPSSSQETLRPSRSGSRFLIAEDEDDGFVDPSVTWNMPNFGGPSTAPNTPVSSSPSSSSLNGEPAGMRRTPSGMFMPYQEGEAAAVDGILNRVVDTVNTARDIAHVIWNVGWRR